VFIENELVKDVNIIYCSPENIDRYASYYDIWVWIDLSLNVLFPFAFMLICSVIIIIGIFKSSNNLSITNVTNKTSQMETAALNVNSDDTVIKSVYKKKSVIRSFSRNSKARNVSFMLATNNLLFILLTLPIVVYLSMAPHFRNAQVCDDTKAKLRLVKVVCIILMHLNCIINIFIYSAFSTEFRRQLCQFVSDSFICKKSFR
jgi:uncharacterized membrane protein